MDTNDKEVRTTEQLYGLRKLAVRLHLKGLPVMRIVAMTGLSWPAVRAALDRYEAGGLAALKPAIRGKKPGTGRSLSREQEQAICRILCDQRPEQLKMAFALWSRAAVGQLIEQEYGIKLHVRSVGKYLARWGFTPQKPVKKAYEQRPEAVRQWLDEQYPAIAERARAEGSEIHWGDETALVNTDVRGRSYAPAGQAPVAWWAGHDRNGRCWPP